MTKPDEVLEIIEIARETGKISKGVNEATKSAERGIAKAVVVAQDTDPPEIILHLPSLCEEKGVIFLKVPSKSELGRAAGINVPCAAIGILNPGEAKSKLENLK